MRKATILGLSLLLIALASTAVAGVLPDAAAVPAPLALLQQDGGGGGGLNVDVELGGGTTEVWYANPVWIGIGVLVLVLVVVLVALAARGGSGGTTVVKG